MNEVPRSAGRDIAWVTALIACALSGCATIPEDKCASMDWKALGVADGRTGYAAERLVQHREACAGVKVAPDERAYLEGRRAGLVEYCRLPAALDHGLAGRSYAGVCNDPRYGRLYTAARKVYESRAKVPEIEREIAGKYREIGDAKTSDVRRDILRKQVRDLESQRSRLRDARSDAESALDALRRELGV
ncbi:hypothetical protein BURK2_00758 [Burkholderiales bacterium]|nr:MAG: DUF2799 domain-containing protein [Burkholderiales bacterium]CAG0961434.1 hypothetical protein BURK2_00758 [Burkholderiales bacterium]